MSNVLHETKYYAQNTLDLIKDYVALNTNEDCLSILTFLDYQKIYQDTYEVLRNKLGDTQFKKTLLIHLVKNKLKHLLKLELEFLKSKMDENPEEAYTVFPYDKEGKNAFHYAASQGDIEIFEMIEEYFSSYINSVSRKTGYSTLEYAVAEGNVKITEYLLKKGALKCTTFTNKFWRNGFTSYRHTPQHTAASNLNFDILFKLIEYDANMSIKINGVNVFKEAEIAGASPEQLEEFREKESTYRMLNFI